MNDLDLGVFWAFLGVLLGSSWGSFVHVVYWRTQTMWLQTKRGEKVTIWWSFPNSHCPSCKHELSWYENMPFFGWLLLRGKCRHCDAKIPARYVLWELFWGVLGGVVVYVFEVYGVGVFVGGLLFFFVIEMLWRLSDHLKHKNQ